MSICECPPCNSRRKLFFTFDLIDEFIASVESRIEAQFFDFDIIDELIDQLFANITQIATELQNNTIALKNDLQDKAIDFQVQMIDNIDSAQSSLYNFVLEALYQLVWIIIIIISGLLFLRFLYQKLFK